MTWRSFAIVIALLLLVPIAPALGADVPEVLAPADGAVVNQASDAILLAPYEGSLSGGFGLIVVASSPVTNDQYFGSPPGSDPSLHDAVGFLPGAPGATIYRLSTLTRTAQCAGCILTPGTYYYRIAYEGQWGPIRSFAIAAPPPTPFVPMPTPPAAAPSVAPTGEALRCDALSRELRRASARVALLRTATAQAKTARVRRVRARVLKKAITHRRSVAARITATCPRP